MKFRKAVKLFGAVSMAGALVLATAACGDDDSNGGDADSDDEEASVGAGSAHDTVMASLQNLDGETYAMDIDLGGFGSGSFEVDLPSESQQGELTFDFAEMAQLDDDFDDSMADHMPEEMVMEMIVIGDDIYMKYDGGPMFGDDDGLWEHMNAEDFDSVGGDVDQFQAMDMQTMTEEMMDSLDDVEQVDDNTYTGTMELSTIDSAMGMGGGDASGESAEVTITLDDDEMLQMVEMDMDVVGSEFVLTMEITDYGMPVDIQAPADDEVRS